MTKLKPCPFCGKEVKIKVTHDDHYVIECDNCNSSTSFPYLHLRDDIINAWNTRPNPWNTGTPTDRDGIFLIQTKMNNLFLVRWADGFWEETTGDDCLEDNDILAWQKITLNEEKEDGR